MKVSADTSVVIYSMKSIIVYTLFVIILFTGCGTYSNEKRASKEKLMDQAPKWYHSQKITTHSKPFEIVGFGDGETFEDAKIKAKNEIAKQIQTILKSQYSIKEYYSSNEKQDNYNVRIQNNISEKTTVELDDIVIIRSEFRNDRAYIALKYINLPTAHKVKYKLDLNVDYNYHGTNESKYLSKTSLMKNLKLVLGYEPQMTLVYKNCNWYIVIGQILTRLPSFELIDLWAGCESKALKIKSTKNSLSEGDIFHLKIDIYEKGYLSLFNVYQTGQTIILLKNQLINNNTQLTYPDIEKYIGLEANIPKNQINSMDLYISVLCCDKKDFSRYEPIDNKHLASQQSYLFGDLLENIKGCHIASDIVHMKP